MGFEHEDDEEIHRNEEKLEKNLLRKHKWNNYSNLIFNTF